MSIKEIQIKNPELIKKINQDKEALDLERLYSLALLVAELLKDVKRIDVKVNKETLYAIAVDLVGVKTARGVLVPSVFQTSSPHLLFSSKKPSKVIEIKGSQKVRYGAQDELLKEGVEKYADEDIEICKTWLKTVEWPND
ncbi:MAG: hypothetical protein A2Z27_05955 [candidate division Zixibacteria bacterium RBG_16_50_21]|nr:MAG: hypothetical protein A2Z27_05955 [candidate division Zixibacteria bacterium RBG_16_50_21]